MFRFLGGLVAPELVESPGNFKEVLSKLENSSPFVDVLLCLETSSAILEVEEVIKALRGAEADLKEGMKQEILVAYSEQQAKEQALGEEPSLQMDPATLMNSLEIEGFTGRDLLVQQEKMVEELQLHKYNLNKPSGEIPKE